MGQDTGIASLSPLRPSQRICAYIRPKNLSKGSWKVWIPLWLGSNTPVQSFLLLVGGTFCVVDARNSWITILHFLCFSLLICYTSLSHPISQLVFSKVYRFYFSSSAKIQKQNKKHGDTGPSQQRPVASFLEGTQLKYGPKTSRTSDMTGFICHHQGLLCNFIPWQGQEWKN